MKVEQRAFQMPVADSAMRAYLQSHPFGTGPDPAMNESCQAALLAHFAPRTQGQNADGSITRLQPEQTRLAAEVIARLHDLLRKAGIGEERWDYILDDFGWEATKIPATAKDVLIIGVGEGFELLFLRAVLPEAKLTALDYGDKMTAQLKAAVDVRFFCGDMNVILEELGETFDLVSLNHTLEHLYTPDEVLHTLCDKLRPEGALISTLPLDGKAGSPFLDKVNEAARAGTAHPVDVVYLDAGHPWKTNPADLRGTLIQAGFARVEIYQRAEHLSRAKAMTEADFDRRKQHGVRLHERVFGTARAVVKGIFGKRPPQAALRLLMNAERRFWFGANRLKNEFTHEACVVAFK